MKDTAAHYIQVLIDQPRLTYSSRGRALVAALERHLPSNQTFATIYSIPLTGYSTRIYDGVARWAETSPSQPSPAAEDYSTLAPDRVVDCEST